MQIYVDADGFPRAAKEILIRAALRLGVPLVFVANKPIRREPSPLISSLIVPEGPDIADDRIAEMAEPGDLVVTADIPLADRVVSKGAFALNPRGKLYTEENIKDRLAVRDLLSELRDRIHESRPGLLRLSRPVPRPQVRCHSLLRGPRR